MTQKESLSVLQQNNMKLSKKRESLPSNDNSYINCISRVENARFTV